MQLVFIKQASAATAISRPASSAPRARFPPGAAHLRPEQALFRAAGELRSSPHPRRLHEAAKVLLVELQREPTEAVLLLNGFVIESHHPGFFPRALKGAGKRIAGWQIDEPY